MEITMRIGMDLLFHEAKVSESAEIVYNRITNGKYFDATFDVVKGDLIVSFIRPYYLDETRQYSDSIFKNDYIKIKL